MSKSNIPSMLLGQRLHSSEEDLRRCVLDGFGLNRGGSQIDLAYLRVPVQGEAGAWDEIDFAKPERFEKPPYPHARGTGTYIGPAKFIRNERVRLCVIKGVILAQMIRSGEGWHVVPREHLAIDVPEKEKYE